MTERAKLAKLVRQARAWVEWSHECGGDGLLSSENAADVLARLEPGRRVGQRPRGAERDAQRAPAPRKHAAAHAPPATHERTASTPQSPPSSSPSQHTTGLSFDERKQRLTVLAREVSECTRCPLHETRTQTVFERGNQDAELAFVGEGPGSEEDRQGLPFVGPAGLLLDKMIAAMGFHRDEVYVANIVKCRPPKNRKPTEDEIAACTPYLREQLALVQPKAMVALGATGVQGLLGTRMGITRMRGDWKLYRGRIPLMPTFHPAYLLRSPEKKRDVWNDLKAVLQRLGREPPTPRKKG